MFPERDYLALGPAPASEECVQVGAPDYEGQVNLECSCFKRVIEEALGPPPVGASLEIRGFSHDFGVYYELVCSFESGNRVAREYAFRCENSAPVEWPERVRLELGL